MKRARWLGYIKDYEGGTLMECAIDTAVDYLSIRFVAEQQRAAMEQATSFLPSRSSRPHPPTALHPHTRARARAPPTRARAHRPRVFRQAHDREAGRHRSPPPRAAAEDFNAHQGARQPPWPRQAREERAGFTGLA